jgi:hypothetical protein
MRRMAIDTNLDHLSDDALLAELSACCVAGRKLDVDVLVYLMGIEERRIHLLRACSSMWDFCRRKLGFSGGQTYRRLACARLARRYPFLLGLLQNGFTHMSTLAQIHLFVGDDNVHALVADTAGKSRDEVDRILADRFGLRKKAKVPRGTLEIDAELEELMTRARELTSHAIPDGDRLKMAKRAFRLLIADEERRQRARAERPRPAPLLPTKSIPRASTRAMFEKHGEQCCYVDPKTGERCPSRLFIQRDHRRMRCRGGGHGPENLLPLCGPHNRLLAELALGRDYVGGRIRFRQRKQKDANEPPID